MSNINYTELHFGARGCWEEQENSAAFFTVIVDQETFFSQELKKFNYQHPAKTTVNQLFSDHKTFINTVVLLY